MNTNDIKQELNNRGITIKAFAGQLGISYGALLNILSGRNPLTEQLKRHIELLLGKAKEQVIMYKVTLPDEVVERWVPGWDRLTEEERQAAVKSVLMDAVAQLQAMGESRLSPDERAQLQAFCGQAAMPSPLPAPPEYGQALDPFA